MSMCLTALGSDDSNYPIVPNAVGLLGVNAFPENTVPDTIPTWAWVWIYTDLYGFVYISQETFLVGGKHSDGDRTIFDIYNQKLQEIQQYSLDWKAVLATYLKSLHKLEVENHD